MAISCGFCPLTASSEVKEELGRLVEFEGLNLSAHSKCLQFSANLYQDEDASWDPKLVAKEFKRIKKLKCSVCVLAPALRALQARNNMEASVIVAWLSLADKNLHLGGAI